MFVGEKWKKVDVCGAHLSKCSSIIPLHPCTKLVWMSLSLPPVVYMQLVRQYVAGYVVV